MITFLLLSAFSTFGVHYKHNAQRCFLLIFSFVIFYFHIAEYFSIKSLERLWWGLIGLGIFEGIVGSYRVLFLGEYRAIGTFYNPNHLAGFLACLLMLLFARLVFNPSFRKSLVFKILIIILLGVAIFLTRSRGGFFALLGGGIGFLFLIRSKKKGILPFDRGPHSSGHHPKSIDKKDHSSSHRRCVCIQSMVNVEKRLFDVQRSSDIGRRDR